MVIVLNFGRNVLKIFDDALQGLLDGNYVEPATSEDPYRVHVLALDRDDTSSLPPAFNVIRVGQDGKPLDILPTPHRREDVVFILNGGTTAQQWAMFRWSRRCPGALVVNVQREPDDSVTVTEMDMGYQIEE